MVAPCNIRFPADLFQEVNNYADTHATNRSAVVVQAVKEWLSTQRHPLVRFVAQPGGERRAALIGGPEVWSVAEAWLAQPPEERSVSVVAEVTGATPVLVEAALTYWADHREEIDGLLDRLHKAQDEALAAWERRQELAHLS